jgi:AcrR family transcriptional regulator
VEANRRYMDLAYDPELSPAEQVLAAADAYLRFHLDHPGYFQMVALPHLGAAPGAQSAEVAERIARRVEIEVGRLEEVIRRGVESGDILAVDPGRAATFLWGAWNGVVALSARPDRLRVDDAELREVLELGRRIVLQGLAPASRRIASGALSARVRFPSVGSPPDGD